MKRESQARIYVVLGIGLVLSAMLTMFLRVGVGVYANQAGLLNNRLVWMLAPMALYGVAAVIAIMAAWVPALRVARAAASASVIWPVCVIAALLMGVHFWIPVAITAALLGGLLYATRNIA